MCGVTHRSTFTLPTKTTKPVTVIEELEPIQLREPLSAGTATEWWKLAQLRCVDVHAVDLAVEMGVIRFGIHRGQECWFILDESRFNIEARRLDGNLFDHTRKKVDTLKGSKKCWPVGIRPAHSKERLINRMLVLEGSADLVAAYHFLYATGKMDALPVAMLGKANKRIHPDALKQMKGKDVRIYPHTDGLKAAKIWGKQIEEAGAKSVTYFDFSNLTRRDGKPVSDLNDCTVICDEDEPELKELLP